MSFEDDTISELKEFFSSKIDKILSTKLEKLDKIDGLVEEVTQLRSENRELKQQNTILTQQLTNLNTTLLEFCHKAGAELVELRDGQKNMKNMFNEEAKSKVSTQESPKDKLAINRSKDTKVTPSSYRNSQTDMDNPNRVLTPLESNQSDISLKEQKI